MINSLYKDSHITQSFDIQYFGKCSQNISGSKRQNRTVNNNTITSFSKPAEVHFCGLAGAKLANTKSFKTLFENVEKFLNKKAKVKEIKNLLSDSIFVITGNLPKVKGKVKEIPAERISAAKEFLSSNQKSFDDSLKDAKVFVNEDISEYIANENRVGRAVTKESKIDKEQQDLFETFRDASEGFPAIGKGEKSFFANPRLKKILTIATDHKSVYSALFALVLTCVLRPGAILTMPSSKKNVDDNKYAAAHSIASGMIGAIISILLFLPISAGMKKIKDNPAKFIKDTNNYLRKDKKAMETASTLTSILPDTFTAIPKGTITIALIPIILKNIFGLEKKKHQDKDKLYLSDNPAAINQHKPENTQRTASKTVKGGAN